MFCPVCQAEYEPGIETCADDGAQLVERLTPEMTLHDDSEARFVPLHNVGSPAEAEMVADILTQNGVRAGVQSGPKEALSPLLSGAAPRGMVIEGGCRLDPAQDNNACFFCGDSTPRTGTNEEGDG